MFLTPLEEVYSGPLEDHWRRAHLRVAAAEEAHRIIIINGAREPWLLVQDFASWTSRDKVAQELSELVCCAEHHSRLSTAGSQQGRL